MYWEYFKYIVRHKWFVYKECVALGIPILGIIHDWSKFLPDEFIPYARRYYGPKYDPGTREKAEVELWFQFALSKHFHRNKHHWQHYILVSDNNKAITLPMPGNYLKEMLADWIGTGKSKGKSGDAWDWYASHADIIKLHPITQAWIETKLGKARI